MSGTTEPKGSRKAIPEYKAITGGIYLCLKDSLIIDANLGSDPVLDEISLNTERHKMLSIFAIKMPKKNNIATSYRNFQKFFVA